MTDGTVTTPASAAELDRPGLTQMQRIVYTFSAPAKTFTDILRNTSWWMPFLLSVVLSYAFIFTMTNKIGWEKITESGMRQNPKQAEQMQNMPADQRAQAMQMGMAITKGITY